MWNFYGDMEQKKQLKAVLFDLDGTLMDTEGQYTHFWTAMGKIYLPEKPNFVALIKGNTMQKIWDTYFNGKEKEREVIEKKLLEFERQMSFPIICGAREFIGELKLHGILCAVVTSSDRKKMQNVWDKQPYFMQLFDKVFTAEDFSCSKPHPDPYLKAASSLGVDITECIIFEDAINGLKSAMASGAYTIALTTENPKEVVEPLSHYTIENFTEINFNLCQKLLLLSQS